MNEKESILIVDDDESTRRSLSLIFGKKGYETETARTGQEALEKTRGRFFNLALLDLRLPDMEGIGLLVPLKEMHPDMVLILVTGYASLETAVQALNEGASAYITKPLNMDEILATVREALEKQRLVLENRRLYQEIQQELAERKQAEEKIQQRTAQLEALQQVGLEITAQLDLDVLLHSIVSRAIRLMSGTSGGLYLHRPERDVLEWATVVGPSPVPTGSTLQRGEGLSGRVWETGEPLVVNDYQHWEGRAAAYERLPIAAVVGAPVRWGDKFLGVLTVEGDAQRAFSPADAGLLSLFATQAAIAMRNARLYEEAKRRLAEARLVQEVMLATASTLDFNFALERTVKALHRALEIDRLGFLLPDERDSQLVSYPSLVGVTTESAFRIPIEGSLVGQAYRTGQPVLVRDMTQEGAYLEQGSEIRSALAVPVRIGGRIVAVLHAESPQVGAFGEDELRLFTTIAGQLGVTLENARLFAETQKSAQQMQALYETSRALSSSLEEEPVLRTILEAVYRTFGCEYVIISTVEEEAESISIRHGIWHGEFDVFPEWIQMTQYPLGHPDMLTDVYRTGRTEVIEEWDERFDRQIWDEFGQERFLRVFMPIKIRDRVVGIVEAGYSKRGLSQKGGHVGEDEMQMLATFMDQAAAALQNARLFTSLAREKERLDLLYRLSHRLSESLDVHDVAQRALDGIRAVLGALRGVAWVREPGSDRLWLVAISGYDAESAKRLDQRIRLRVGEGLAGWVAAQRQPALVEDVTKDEQWRTVSGLDDWIRSALSVPLVSRKEIVGVLNIYSDQVGFFNDDHRRLAESAAATVAAAVANARLYEAERDRRQEAETLREAALVLTTALDRNEVIERILAQLQEVVPYDSASVQLFRGDRMEIVGGRGFSNLPDILGLPFLVGGDNPNSEVVHTRAPLIVADASAAYGEFRHQAHAQASIRSWLGVPMLVGKRLVGMIALDKRAPGFYTQEHARLAEAFAAQAAIAVENSRLFQAEREQRELAEALEEAAAAVSSTLDPDQVLDHILEQVERVVPGDAFNIMLVENNTARVVRHRGYERLGVEDAISRFAAPIADHSNLVRMTQSGKPVVTPDAAADPDWVPLEGQEWLRSYVGAPIRVGGVTVGFLNVAGTRPGQFNPADARRLAAFAGHVATAIENARLHRELLNHAKQLEQRVQERTAQLQAQYARLDAILRSASDGIVVADRQGDILQTNSIAHTWLTQTLSPEDAARLRETVQYLAQRAEERPETVLELTGLDLELRAAPISQPGMEEEAAVVAVHDVSHLKALERVKSRFVSNVSHELRTPITTIKLYAALMQQTPPEEEEWGQYLDALAQEADRQAQLVENILQISRIDTGRLEMKPRPTSLNQLTEQAVASHQMLAQKRGLTLEHHTAEPGPVTLVDPVRMMQVLNNLVENAIRYTPEGGKVVVSTGREETEGRVWTTATVSDTGMGIPEEELPRIFERFFRGEEVRLMQISGTGLGLAIVKEIVELHGGRVGVESQVDVGTTFTVWLPLAR